MTTSGGMPPYSVSFTPAGAGTQLPLAGVQYSSVPSARKWTSSPCTKVPLKAWKPGLAVAYGPPAKSPK